MEKHNQIHLYLDNDDTGKKWLDFAMNRSKKYIDSSKLYQGYKDLNDWHTNFGKLLPKKEIKKSIGRSLTKL